MRPNPRMGVLLIQLGTPHDPSVPSVRRFLREFLSDPRVLDIPGIVRFFLVNLIIAPFRARKSSVIYTDLWNMSDNRSPILVHTRALTEQLNTQLSDDRITVHMAMRYQGPSIPDVLEEMRVQNYDKILVVPLFPQYASSSSGTAMQLVMEVVAKWWAIPHLELVSQFYNEPFYVNTLAAQALKHDPASFDHVIMSYHGLPDRHVDKVYEGGTNLCKDHNCEQRLDTENGLCYKATAYETSRAIAKEMGLSEDEYTVTFQSRLTNAWLTPFSDEVIETFAREGKKRLLILSPSFVADCLETLIEVGDEYAEIFAEHGGEKVQLVASCNTEETWVHGLAGFIRARHLRPPSTT
ncbi:MAG TPA: ferrochelatase [Deltaproteobacteria bacterium]|nr:ferrochelatase [Deltaproteobacteria bacterium]